jgi:hypothetical protein
MTNAFALNADAMLRILAYPPDEVDRLIREDAAKQTGVPVDDLSTEWELRSAKALQLEARVFVRRKDGDHLDLRT